jgi:hypothetical protein
MNINSDDRDPKNHRAAFLKFAYPLGWRIVATIGAVGFLASALASSSLVEWEGGDIWIPLSFLCWGILFAVLWYFIIGRIYLDAQAIAHRKLGREIRIPYDDIVRIEHRFAGLSLVVYGSDTKIVVGRQMSKYPFLYSQLMEQCPSHIIDSPEFPIEVHLLRLWSVVYWLFIIAGGALLFFAIRDSIGIWAIVLGVLLIGSGVLAHLLMPRVYLFDHEGLTVVSSLRHRFLSAEDFQGVSLDQDFDENSLGEYSQLMLVFSTGIVMLSEIAVDYPLEVLASAVSEHYRTTPSDRDPGGSATS